MENPTIQGVWDNEQERQRVSGLEDTVKNYIIWTCHRPPSDRDILSVYFPEYHCEYVFQDANGVSQWYFEPRTDFDPRKDLPAGFNMLRHKFFRRSLIPVRQSIFDSLSALLKFGKPFSHRPEMKQKEIFYYNLKIRINDNFLISSSAGVDPDAHTRHRICKNVKFHHIINLLCGPSQSRPPAQTGLRLVSVTRTAVEISAPATGQQEQEENQQM